METSSESCSQTLKSSEGPLWLDGLLASCLAFKSFHLIRPQNVGLLGFPRKSLSDNGQLSLGNEVLDYVVLQSFPTTPMASHW